MIFTNIRSYVSSSSNENISSHKAMMFTKPKTRHLQHQDIQTHTPNNVMVKISKPYVERVEEQLDSKKIKWGEPFWNFFHLLAEKVKEDEFPKIREGLLKMIYSICTNLPCPDCTMHATIYLNSINFNNIKTKEQFKDMLFHFHNAVNMRKGYKLFPRDELDARYSKGIFVANIDRFLYFYRLKHHNVRLMSDDMYRQRMASIIMEWLKTHMHCFHV
jgi:hypothetical protein